MSEIPGEPSLGKKWSTHPVASGLYGLPGVVDIHEKVIHGTVQCDEPGWGTALAY